MMRFFCVTGDNFTDVALRQIELLGDGLKSKRKQIVIVPDKYISFMEYNILQTLNLTATFDVEVISFSKLADKILKAPKKLSGLGASMVIEKIITEHANELKCFKNTAKTIAFSSVLYEQIDQIKSCMIAPCDLYRAIEKISNPALKLKLSDIALIYDCYEKFLSSNYIDANTSLSLSANYLKESDEYKNFDFHLCYFDSFSDCEFSVIEALLHSAHSVSVGVLTPTENQNNREIYTDEIYQKCLSLSKTIDTQFLSSKNTLSSFSKHILYNLMAIAPQKEEVNDGTSIRLFSATGVSSEVEFVAQDILFKVQNGERFKDCVISVTDMATYAPIFTQIFKKYKIPFWIDNQFELSQSEGAKFVLSALDCVEDNFQVTDVLRYAKNSLAGLSFRDYAVFDNVINRYGIFGTRLKDNDKPNNDDVEFDKYLEIKQFLEPLFTLQENFNKSNTVYEMVASLRNFFEQTSLRENLFGMSASFQERGEIFKRNIARQNFEKIDNVLEQILEIFANDKIELSQFCKIFKAGIQNVKFASLPMSADCVVIGQSMISAMQRSKNYYLLGAIDGNLPSWVADVGLISDYDIIELKQKGIFLTPSIKQRNALSKLKVLQNIALADEQLTISCPMSIAGEECKPASVVEEISKLFMFNGERIPIVFIDSMLQDDNAFGGELNRLDFLWKQPTNMMYGIVEALQDENSKVDETILASGVNALQKQGYSALWSEISAFLNEQKAIAKLENPASVFFTSNKARVTQIEKFFECPYAHFLTYGLKLQQRRTSKPEAVDVGNILHAVFEKFGFMCRKKILSDEEIEQVVPLIFDQVIKRKEFCHITFTGQNKTMLKTLKDEAIRACKAISYQLVHSEYKIKFIETSFGQDGFARVPEVAVINTNQKIKISGKIDRADAWGNKLRIIDYKTSKNSGSFSLLNFYLGKKIQLFYYMQAIVADLGVSAGGAYYLPVHREYTDEGKSTKYSSFKLDGVSLYTEANMFAQDGQVSFEHPNSDIVDFGIKTSTAHQESGTIELRSTASSKTRSASEEQFSNLLLYAKKVLEGAINDIYNGEISPLYIGNACEFCPYKNICRKDILSSAKERRNDYNVDLDSFKLGEKNE